MDKTFGSILKHWRGVRRFSQLGLSHESGFSSRHISFLETGRSKPSRSAILALARVLDMPKLATNQALFASGFTPEYRQFDMKHEDMRLIEKALGSILNNHAPLPAITIDASWNIVGGNSAAQYMIGILPFNGSLNIVDALLNDDPASPAFLNWTDLAVWTALRLQLEAVKQGPGSELQKLYTRLMADPRFDAPQAKSFSTYGPVLSTKVRANDVTLTLFTMLAEFSTVQDIAMSDLRVELFFAADAQTQSFFEGLSST